MTVTLLFAETLATLVHAESQLERYLLETPPNDSNIPKAQQELPKPRQLLVDCLKGDPGVSSPFYECFFIQYFGLIIVLKPLRNKY